MALIDELTPERLAARAFTTGAYPSLGEVVATLRTLVDLTRRQLAKESGHSETLLARLENGMATEDEITTALVSNLARVLGSKTETLAALAPSTSPAARDLVSATKEKGIKATPSLGAAASALKGVKRLLKELDRLLAVPPRRSFETAKHLGASGKAATVRVRASDGKTVLATVRADREELSIEFAPVAIGWTWSLRATSPRGAAIAEVSGGVVSERPATASMPVLREEVERAGTGGHLELEVSPPKPTRTRK